MQPVGRLRWELSSLGLRFQFALLLGMRLAKSNGLRRSRAQCRVQVAQFSSAGVARLWLRALGWWGGAFLASTCQETTRIVSLVYLVDGGKILLTRDIFAQGLFCRVLEIGHERATTSILLVRKVMG